MRPKTMFERWDGLFIPSLKHEWGNAWDKMRSKKEEAFIWSLWHKAIRNGN